MDGTPDSARHLRSSSEAPPITLLSVDGGSAVEVFVEKSGRETSRSCSRQPSPVAEPPEAEESTHAAAAIFTLQRRRKEAPLTCSEFTPEGTNGEGDAVTLLRRLGGVRLRCRDAGEDQLPPSTKRRKTGGGDRRSCETPPPPTLAVVAPLSTRACCDERRTLPCSKLPPSSVALPLQEKGSVGREPLAGVVRCWSRPVILREEARMKQRDVGCHILEAYTIFR
nr:hypothetical protein Iba_scaffold24013CG0370 [Ipomoea batatas]